MTNISEEFNFGEEEKIKTQELILYLKDMYRILARAINTKPQITTIDDFPEEGGEATLFDVGDIFLKPSSNEAKMITSRPNQTTVVLTDLTNNP